jgi:hypothetical protein
MAYGYGKKVVGMSAKKKTTTKKKVPKGYHMMPNGKLMKGATHKAGKRKTPVKRTTKR